MSKTTKAKPKKARKSTTKSKVKKPSETNTTNIKEHKMTKSVDYENFSKETMSSLQEGTEAIAKAQTLALKGFEDYLKSLSDIAQKSADSQTNALKKLMECNSLNEMTQAQQSATQQIIDDTLVNASRLSELTVKLYTDAMEPINSHITKTYKKVSNSLAG